MALACDRCFLTFPTNTKLYVHKKTMHSSPKLVLLNHDHKADTAKRPRVDGEHDDNFEIVDEYLDDGGVYPRKKRKINPELDDGIPIIDEVNDGDGGDDDGDDGQPDPDMVVVDEYNRKKNYKSLYKDCLKRGRNLQVNHTRKLEALELAHKTDLKEKLEAQQRDFDGRLAELKRKSDKKMADLEELKDQLFADEKKKLHEELEETKNDCGKLKSSIKGYIDQIGDLETKQQQKN